MGEKEVTRKGVSVFCHYNEAGPAQATAELSIYFAQ